MTAMDTAHHGIRIGLEIHARLLTKSKAFCSCPADADAAPNTCVCPVCLGLPGALPVANSRMIECALLVGLACSSEIHTSSVFARKNYVYPDLPKGYQITQHDRPICTGGAIPFRDSSGQLRELELWRMHVEEDAAKLMHDRDGTIVDHNRCGIPLLEIVTAPDLASAEDAVAVAKEVRRLLMFLGISDGRMEQGSLRCDVNVSVATGDGPGVRSEIKNLNSFSSIRHALRWEIARQQTRLDDFDGPSTVTLQWNEQRGSGQIMRAKEQLDDYRFVVEPDLPTLQVTDEMLEIARASLVELPLQREERFRADFGLSAYQAGVLCAEPATARYFEQLCALLPAFGSAGARLAANWVTGEVLRHARQDNDDHSDFPVSPERLAELLGLLLSESISETAAKRVFAAMLASREHPAAIVQRLGLEQITDPETIDALAEEIIALHPDQAAQWQAGKTNVFAFLMGELMRHCGGRVHPGLAAARLEAALQGTVAVSDPGTEAEA